MNLQLSGKRALVTGGSRGIGKAVAHALASEGVRVVICSRNVEEITKAATELSKSTSSDVFGVHADMGNHLSIKALLSETIAKLGGLDILVNNAARVSGGPTPDSLLEGNDELLRYDFETKMLGYVRAAREAAPQMMKNQWGRIINISGMAARGGVAISAGMRNIALISLTKSLSKELGPYGITSNAVLPGAVITENRKARLEMISAKSGVPPATLDLQDANSTALKRVVTSSEIGGVVTYLCSPLAQSITGEALSVAGGGNRTIPY